MFNTLFGCVCVVLSFIVFVALIVARSIIILHCGVCSSNSSTVQQCPGLPAAPDSSVYVAGLQEFKYSFSSLLRLIARHLCHAHQQVSTFTMHACMHVCVCVGYSSQGQ